MLLPQFSLKTILALVPVAALLALAVASAAGGGVWGVAVTMGSVCLLVCLASYVLFFLLCTGLSSLVGSEEVVARTSRGGVIRESASSDKLGEEAVSSASLSESENR
ncbi:MAG: hypothetical protein RH917_14780 [Lacipirellulaceae bacterium]